MIRASFGSGRQRALVLLFIPSVERDGTTAVDQNRWSEDAMKMLGTVFGGATSFPRAPGVWRDDERDGALVFDEPVMVWSLVAPESLNDEKTLDELQLFCRRMGRETDQGEIGLVVDNEYYAITNFAEEYLR
jgi:hypothetical protein